MKIMNNIINIIKKSWFGIKYFHFKNFYKLYKAGYKIRLWPGGNPGHVLYYNDDFQFFVNKKMPNMAAEIFYKGLYDIVEKVIEPNEHYVIFDIGSNRGYASILFASNNWCKKVFAFEIIPEIYYRGLQNIKLNKRIREKVELFSYGLGASDEIVKAFYSPNKDYMSTIIDDYVIQVGQQTLDNNHFIFTECIVKNASNELRTIVMKNNIENNIIMKIDVEGAEYEILNDLTDNYPSLFEKICIIIGEAHLGIKPIQDILEIKGFRLISLNKKSDGFEEFLFMKNKGYR